MAEFAAGNAEAPRFSWTKMADWIREPFKFQQTPVPMACAQLEQHLPKLSPENRKKLIMDRVSMEIRAGS